MIYNKVAAVGYSEDSTSPLNYNTRSAATNILNSGRNPSDGISELAHEEEIFSPAVL
jgi:hypothetical protein